MEIILLILLAIGAFGIFGKHNDDAVAYYDAKRAKGTMGANPVDAADESAQGCSGIVLFVAGLIFCAIVILGAGTAAMEDGALIGPGTELSKTSFECGWNFVCRTVPLD